MRTGWFVALALSGAVLGCYNSQWGEAKHEQERAMARATPPKLLRAEAHGTITPLTVSVHAAATSRYTSQVVDARRQFEEAVAENNRVLSGVGITLRVDSFEVWETDEDDLFKALSALEAKEKAGPATLHVGLLGALPRATASFHELGLASVLGHHLVLRAPARADEVDAIEHGFSELTADEREGLVKGRRKHRAAALLLHEVGHTFGAIHDGASVSLMNPEYTHERSGFSEENATLMAIVVRHRAAPPTAKSAAALAKELEDTLAKMGSGGDFVEKDRDEMRSLLAGMRGAAPAPSAPARSPAAPAAPATSDADLEGLPPEGRATFRRAEALFTAGDASAAWEAGKALFVAHPKSFATQDLRCRVAMKAFAYDKAIGECEAISALTLGKK